MPPVHPTRSRTPAAPEWKRVGREKVEKTPAKGHTADARTDIVQMFRDDNGKRWRLRTSAIPRSFRDGNRELNKRPRVYTSTSDEFDALYVTPMRSIEEMKELFPDDEVIQERDSMYGSRAEAGGSKNIDKEFDRANGEHVAMGRMLCKWIMPRLDPAFQDATFHFSNYAGCSCPCSPGYIVKSDRSPRMDFWIEVTSEDEYLAHKEKMRKLEVERAQEEAKAKRKEAEKLRREADRLEAAAR